ncbi:hypothetical protein [Elizabethkingia meningoseptica]|uniref:hypothetical protein n=1 Tax=Elizabethkingia meningoseptica TaxID=238 RepID=UPI0023B024F7|nr:hypothetical protein [Elizabethkingia meningoseptica]MDE5525679.1 hypothetical protein [Elizabethkingia meningoseptica]
MIVYIDLKDQIIEGEDRFAFYDTITDSFCSFSGCQSWTNMDEFKMDYDGDEIDRFLSKIPPGFSGTFEISGRDIADWREAIVRCMGEPIGFIQPPTHPRCGDPRRDKAAEEWKKTTESSH